MNNFVMMRCTKMWYHTRRHAKTIGPEYVKLFSFPIPKNTIRSISLNITASSKSKSKDNFLIEEDFANRQGVLHSRFSPTFVRKTDSNLEIILNVSNKNNFVDVIVGGPSNEIVEWEGTLKVFA